jgi:uncharacterized membrane protein
MALVGHLHPLLIHFPIALVVAAVAAEGAAMFTANDRWRAVAIANVRGAALFSLLAAFAGWRMAIALDLDGSSLLEWHRWCGIGAAALTVIAAIATCVPLDWAGRGSWCFRIAVFGAAALMALAGHLGGLMVWGADFLSL